jgi:8-oxo-dGTP diphosphatase
MINVTCAIIRNEENQILVVQKGEKTDHPYKWEFPGGKLDKGESEEDCIIREINEELSIDIIICGRLPEVVHDYGNKKIKLIPFICDSLDDLPFLSEHLAYRWLSANDLLKVDFSEADVFVAMNYLKIFKDESLSEKKVTVESEQILIDDDDLKAMVNRLMGAKETLWIANSAIENPAIFVKLLDYSLSSDKKLAFHASWALTKVCDSYPEIIYPYFSDLIEALSKIDNESVQRSFLRILSLSAIDKINNSQHGILADFCFNILKSGNSAIAVKAYSMEILYQLSVLYPEITNELSATIHLIIEDASAGIRARGKMILKKLAMMPVNSKSSQL